MGALTDYLCRKYAAKPGAPSFLTAGRLDLPRLTRDLGYTEGAEVGVWKGEYSARFCEGNPDLHMLCVDPWEPYQAWRDTKNTLTGVEAQAFMAEAHKAALARLKPFKATIVRQFSAQAAETVPEGSLNFVYIDGNHGYDAVLEDLEAWTPKVKPGGFVAGHDYRVNPAKPFIEVVKAVNAWTFSHAISPWFVLSRDLSPSFIWEVA